MGHPLTESPKVVLKQGLQIYFFVFFPGQCPNMVFKPLWTKSMGEIYISQPIDSDTFSSSSKKKVVSVSQTQGSGILVHDRTLWQASDPPPPPPTKKQKAKKLQCFFSRSKGVFDPPPPPYAPGNSHFIIVHGQFVYGGGGNLYTGISNFTSSKEIYLFSIINVHISVFGSLLGKRT